MKCMELKTAIEILQYHQKWRMGEVHSMHHSPATLTQALDIVLDVAIRHRADVETAYNAGREYGCKHDDAETGEQYYNQTYGKE